METKKVLKVIGAIGAGLVLVSSGAFTSGVIKNDAIQEQEAQISQLKLDKIELDNKIVDLEAVEPVTEIVEKEVDVIVEVEVDNGNLDLVLDHIYDNKGNIRYITNDLDDDEVKLIVDRIVFINEIKALAVAEVENEFKDLLDKEDFGGEDRFFDEDDIERVRVQDDDDEVMVIDPDFEDKDADIEINVKFEQDGEKYIALVNVEFRDGEVDDIDLKSVELR